MKNDETKTWWRCARSPNISDQELARHAQRAYMLAQQHGEDQWVAVARMMRSYLHLAGDCPLSAAAEGWVVTVRRAE